MFSIIRLFVVLVVVPIVDGVPIIVSPQNHQEGPRDNFADFVSSPDMEFSALEEQDHINSLEESTDIHGGAHEDFTASLDAEGNGVSAASLNDEEEQDQLQDQQDQLHDLLQLQDQRDQEEHDLLAHKKLLIHQALVPILSGKGVVSEATLAPLADFDASVFEGLEAEHVSALEGAFRNLGKR
jgi:hypothetical protein